MTNQITVESLADQFASLTASIRDLSEVVNSIGEVAARRQHLETERKMNAAIDVAADPDADRRNAALAEMGHADLAKVAKYGAMEDLVRALVEAPIATRKRLADALTSQNDAAQAIKVEASSRLTPDAEVPRHVRLCAPTLAEWRRGRGDAPRLDAAGVRRATEVGLGDRIFHGRNATRLALLDFGKQDGRDLEYTITVEALAFLRALDDKLDASIKSGETVVDHHTLDRDREILRANLQDVTPGYGYGVASVTADAANPFAGVAVSYEDAKGRIWQGAIGSRNPSDADAEDVQPLPSAQQWKAALGEAEEVAVSDDKPITGAITVLALELESGCRLEISLNGQLHYDLITPDEIRHPIKASDAATIASMLR